MQVLILTTFNRGPNTAVKKHLEPFFLGEKGDFSFSRWIVQPQLFRISPNVLE